MPSPMVFLSWKDSEVTVLARSIAGDANAHTPHTGFRRRAFMRQLYSLVEQ